MGRGTYQQWRRELERPSPARSSARCSGWRHRGHREPTTTKLIGTIGAHPARVLFIVLPERRSTGLRSTVGGDQHLHTREPCIIGCRRVDARPPYCAPHRSFGGVYLPQSTSSSSSLRKTRDPSSRAIAQRPRKSPVTPEPTGVGDDVAVIVDDHPCHAQPWIAHQPRAPRSAGADPHVYPDPPTLLIAIARFSHAAHLPPHRLLCSPAPRSGSAPTCGSVNR